MANFWDSIWNFTIFNEMKKNKTSLPFIMGSLFLILIIGLFTTGEVSNFIFLFSGLIIIYTSYIYGQKAAYLVTVISIIIHILGVYPDIIDYINKGLWDEIIVEKFVIVFLFFTGVLWFSKLLNIEREAKENYKKSAEACIITSKDLAMANASINELYVSTIQALASSIEFKDPYTKGHSERVTKYAVAIAREMHLNAEDVRMLMYAAILHDIGKIGVDEAILKKPGALTEEEFEQIKKHPEIGGSIISSVKFLQPIISTVVHHHERYDGTGYPSGKKGDEIPIGARILSVVDAYDAMIYDRPYRESLDIDQAREQIKQGAGSQFDPKVTCCFLKILDKEISGKSLQEKLKISAK